jgi:nitrogen fixation-related uncharacterized protein
MAGGILILWILWSLKIWQYTDLLCDAGPHAVLTVKTVLLKTALKKDGSHSSNSR